MPLFVASNIIATAVLIALVLFGVVSLARRYLQRGHRARKGVAVFRVSQERVGGNLPQFLQALPLPFVFEIVVHHFGKGAQYYLIVPSARAKRIARELGAQAVYDYDIHYSGGVQKGAYLKGGNGLESIQLDKLDFSRVNEIGEGVVIQFVSGRGKSRRRAVNIRILVTAPSEFQAAEIMESVKHAFVGFRIVETKNAEFLQRVYAREFDAQVPAAVF